MTHTARQDNPNDGPLDPGDPGVVGVDGWRGGWVAATVDRRGLRWSAHASFDDVVDTFPLALIGVDMPIGLPIHGYRECELAARLFLGPARSSIFLTPTRAQVARWHPGAAHPLGAGISRQSWNLLPKIVELDELFTDRPDLALRVAEVHPECSFRVLDPATRFESKKTARGVGQRLAALQGWRALPDLVDAPPGVPVDDILDATAVAWTTLRWREQPESLHRFGPVQMDDKGRGMSIIA